MDNIQSILTAVLNAFVSLVQTGSTGAGNIFNQATGSVRDLIN